MADIIQGQFDGDNLMGISVDGQVEFPRLAARPDAVFLIEPFAFAVNLDPGAVDQDMQRFLADDPLWQDLQTAASTAECRVVGDFDPNAEQVRDRAQRTVITTHGPSVHQCRSQANAASIPSAGPQSVTYPTGHITLVMIHRSMDAHLTTIRNNQRQLAARRFGVTTDRVRSVGTLGEGRP
jgi:hypothetical protein